MESVEAMYSVNIPAILGTLLIIGIVLIFLGFREKSNLVRRLSLLKSGMMFIGLTILPIGFLWYAFMAMSQVPLPFYIQDVVLPTVFSAGGGIVIGVALTFKGDSAKNCKCLISS